MFRKRQNKKEELEINITDGKNIIYDEEIPIEDIDRSDNDSLKNKNNETFETDSDSEEPNLGLSTIKTDDNDTDLNFITTIRKPNHSSKPGTSRENNIENRPKSGSGIRPKPLISGSESDSDSDGLMVMEPLRGPLPGEYDPEKFNNLDVPEEIKELFQYITKYTPQHLNLDYKFKPFIPDYIPAVGDIDAFLKILPPERMLFTQELADFSNLGLAVLDEPAANQSDSALLHLQLRAVSVTTNKDHKNLVIKKIDNLEKNSKTVDKWILDISDLHRAKPPPMVKYSNSMPDIDNLMQEWPQAVEMLLRKDGFPSHRLHCSLSEYIDLTCAIFEIPVFEKRIQSLHLLFSLYIAIKNSQLYNLGAEQDIHDISPVNIEQVEEIQINTSITDQLILD